ncbi:hypothetical protein EWW49_30050 [Pseudomonas syringae]|nr:hypothetical protein EWW49_30050 [Pseudomonas syringae]
MLDAINPRKPPRDLTGTIVDADPMHVLAAELWLQGQYHVYRSSLDLVDAETQQRQADIHAARIQVKSRQKTLTIATLLVSAYENLLKPQYIPRHP